MKRNMKLTKKDADIVALKNFLPERKFNETVIKILRAAVKDRVAVVPMEFEIVPFENHPGTKIDLPEDLEQRLCEKFGRRKFTTTVKTLIRQCIQQNLPRNFGPQVQSDKSVPKFSNFVRNSDCFLETRP